MGRIRIIKGDVIRLLREEFGRKPDDGIFYELDRLVGRKVRRYAKLGLLPKVQTWQPEEEDLWRKFGGKLQMRRCWRCSKRSSDVKVLGAMCATCKEGS